MMHNAERVILGMSGGVDSTTAALLLQRSGFEVIGIMLQTWRPEHDVSATTAAEQDAIATAGNAAEHLGISLHVRDIRDLFKREVVRYFVESYSQGLTPNPCVKCNRAVKWQGLFSAAEEFEAMYVATGHYARLEHAAGKVRLLRGIDLQKDQSYFLSHLSQDELSKTLFPNGDHYKSDIKKIAAEAGLFTAANRPESQDLCFLEGHDYRSFLSRYSPGSLQAGKIVDTEGQALGTHTGLANYTIGQRKGLGVSSARPLYVVDKDIQYNTLILGEKHHLGRRDFRVAEMNWISGAAPPENMELEVKIRSQAVPTRARIVRIDHAVFHVHVEKELRDITPGQFAVFYTDAEVLGGGMILPLELPKRL